MRRYFTTFVFLLALLAFGGYSIYQGATAPTPRAGPYVPTLSTDPVLGPQQGLLAVGSVALAVFGTLGLAIFLAISFQRLTLLQAGHPAAETRILHKLFGRWPRLLALLLGGQPAGPAPAPQAAAKATPSKDVPRPLLSDPRSLIVFWVVVVVIGAGFMLLRYWGTPIGYLPPLVSAAQQPVLRLPGEPIQGLPDFLAGPGDDLLVWQLALGVLGFALAGTAAVGFGLAWVFRQMDATLRVADKLPRTAADRLIESAYETAEKQIAALRAPRAPTPPRPASWVDQGLMAFNILAALGLLFVLLIYTTPRLAQVNEVNRSIQATQAASLVTPVAIVAADPSTASAEVAQAEFEALPAGDAAAGQQAFSAAGCVACHSLEPDVRIVGPSLAGVAERAATTKDGYQGAWYLYESITNPNAYVVETFTPGLMPQTFKSSLKPQEIADLVAYLQTLN